MAKLIPPMRRNNQEYNKATWDTRDMTYKEDITRKAIKYGLPTVTKKKFEENVGNDYCTIPPDQLIYLVD